MTMSIESLEFWMREWTVYRKVYDVSLLPTRERSHDAAYMIDYKPASAFAPRIDTRCMIWLLHNSQWPGWLWVEYAWKY